MKKLALAKESEKSLFVFQLHLTTQAGTYIKEFVHGDLGRTIPNLGEILGCEVDIIALDVEVGKSSSCFIRKLIVYFSFLFDMI